LGSIPPLFSKAQEGGPAVKQTSPFVKTIPLFFDFLFWALSSFNRRIPPLFSFATVFFLPPFFVSSGVPLSLPRGGTEPRGFVVCASSPSSKSLWSLSHGHSQMGVNPPQRPPNGALLIGGCFLFFFFPGKTLSSSPKDYQICLFLHPTILYVWEALPTTFFRVSAGSFSSPLFFLTKPNSDLCFKNPSRPFFFFFSLPGTLSLHVYSAFSFFSKHFLSFFLCF